MQTTSQTNNFLDRYHIHSKKERSDETTLIEKQTGELVLMKEVEMASGQQFRQVIETLEGQLGLKHQFLLSLKEYQTGWQHHPDTGCQHKVLTFYEYASHSLLQEIDSRYAEGRLFEERELWNILLSCVLPMAYLQREAVGHGCLSPVDIFIDTDGSTKIVDPSIATSSPLTIQPGYYYSPELLHYFRQSGHRPTEELDIFKADVFSLGVCMIHAAMLQSSDDCYDYEGLDVDYDELQNKINLISEHYSLDFVNVLIAMLKEDVNERPDFLELQQQLNDNIEGGLNESRHSNMTLSGQWSRYTYRPNNRPSEPLSEDLDQVKSELLGVPHPELIDQAIADFNDEEKHDNFDRLLKRHTSNEKIYNLDVLRNRIEQEPQYQIVQRTIKVEYVPNSNTFSMDPSSIQQANQSFSGSITKPLPTLKQSRSSDNHVSFKFASIEASVERQPVQVSVSTNNILNNIANLSFNKKYSNESNKFQPLVFDTKPILSPIDYVPVGNKQSLFTDPAFLAMVRQDVSKIMSKNEQNKENSVQNSAENHY